MITRRKQLMFTRHKAQNWNGKKNEKKNLIAFVIILTIFIA